MKREVYVSTSCLSPAVSLRQRVESLIAEGRRHIELSGNVDASAGDLEFCRSIAHECQFAVHNYFPAPSDSFVLNLASADSRLLRRSREFVRESVGVAAAMRSPWYSVHSGFVTDAGRFDGVSFEFGGKPSALDREQALARFVESLEELVPYAISCGVDLLIENNVCPDRMRGQLLLQTTEEFSTLFERLDGSPPGILLDTGHLNVSARTFGFDPSGFPRLLGDRIRMIHLHSNDGLEDLHWPARDPWMIDLVQNPAFALTPIVVETKFKSMETLNEHVDWLEAMLGTAEGSGK